jgi:hypothetical protein
MNIGIYLSGLGQSFTKETVEKYAERYINDLKESTKGYDFESKIEKIYYADNQDSFIVRIYKIEKGKETRELIYTLYDFDYTDLISEKFNKKNLLLKNLSLFLLVFRKLPVLIKRLKYRNLKQTVQTFYIFGVFLLISSSILILIPSITYSSFPSIRNIIPFDTFKYCVPIIKDGNCTIFDYPVCFLVHYIKSFFKAMLYLTPIITTLILIMPESRTMITKLASEFASLDNYMQYGEQRQIILGNLDKLIDHITENENITSKIQFHSYSFGTIIAIDLLFPIGNIPSINVKENINLLITVGCPYEFIKAYYPNYFKERDIEMEDKIEWINVYNEADAFSTKFDKTLSFGTSTTENKKIKPINLKYGITQENGKNLYSIVTLYHIKVHKSYWDNSTKGQSCTRMIFSKMKELNCFNT